MGDPGCIYVPELGLEDFVNKYSLLNIHINHIYMKNKNISFAYVYSHYEINIQVHIKIEREIDT